MSSTTRRSIRKMDSSTGIAAPSYNRAPTAGSLWTGSQVVSLACDRLEARLRGELGQLAVDGDPQPLAGRRLVAKLHEPVQETQLLDRGHPPAAVQVERDQLEVQVDVARG